MNPEQIKESIQAVVDGLTPLAQKLQVPIEGLFGWAVKHNYAEAVIGLIPLVVFCIVLPVAIKALYRIKWDDDMNADGLVAVAGFIVAFIAGLVALIETGESISRLIAPEWHTVQDIINLIK